MLVQESRLNPQQDKKECWLDLRVPASAAYVDSGKPSKHKSHHAWLMPQVQKVGCGFIYMMCRMYFVS